MVWGLGVGRIPTPIYYPSKIIVSIGDYHLSTGIETGKNELFVV